VSRRRRVTEEELSRLFDVLVEHQALTIHEIATDLECAVRRAQEVVREFRVVFGEDDTINLVCDPQGEGEPWLYSLTGTVEGAGPWTTRRVLDAETRLETMAGVMSSVIRATDGRATDGRKARIIHRAIVRAREDLADLA
jgi:hypothetical protein